MSVLIKMEMPKNCEECDFAIVEDVDFDYTLFCKCNKKYCDLDALAHPIGWSCPLIEVPPHGRLIDADALANKTFYNPVSAPYITYRTFIDAPTIIEAEGSDT